MTLIPAAEQLLHVLVALGVPAARGVGVGQLVHQGDRRPPRQDGVEVHLLQHHAAVLDLAPRHLLQVADQGGGLGPAVRLDDADDHVHALLLEPLPLLEHLVGLADAGGEAEVDLQPAPLLLAEQRQELLRARARRYQSLIDAPLPPRPRREV